MRDISIGEPPGISSRYALDRPISYLFSELLIYGKKGLKQ